MAKIQRQAEEWEGFLEKRECFRRLLKLIREVEGSIEAEGSQRIALVLVPKQGVVSKIGKQAVIAQILTLGLMSLEVPV